MSSFFNFVIPILSPVLLFFLPLGQGLLSQSALQLNSQDVYAAAGYHSNQGLTLGETAAARSGQIGGAIHSYNQVHYFFIHTSYFHLFNLFAMVDASSPGNWIIFWSPSCHPVSSFLFSLCSSLPELWLLLLSSYLVFFLHSPLSLGDIQSCSCSVLGHRLTCSVPERLDCPAGSWRLLSDAHGWWIWTFWAIHVLLLCHVACTGTNPCRWCCNSSVVGFLCVLQLSK